ncbi:acyl carrier protein [Salana multivorans]
MNDATTTQVLEVVGTVLGIEDRAATFDESTPLFGAIPELDSFGILELVTALEERFDFELDDEEFSGEIFETVGSLVSFVQGKAG